eukprot:TRINITY_DN7039_c1_g1_i1.p1 TRINITY_DN7039_c1_g1~~TRINITY_DN7039_c1_g1_i1.p1  ORF type:complete len:166 (+),score=35.85 TRINITY_DN7039_c1_g1_i1:44-541(+)
MPTQWEQYKAARDKALFVPPLAAEDKAFLDTPGPWARSGHYNLSQTMTAFRTQKQQTLARGGSLPALSTLGEGNPRVREEDKISFVASIAGGMPVAEEILFSRTPPRIRQAPLLRSDSGDPRRERHEPPFFKLDPQDPTPGLPDKRVFSMHSPCRDYNFVNTKAW